MMQRYTFVVQVHPGGTSTLENLSTQERIPVSELTEVGAQIEEWLTELQLSSVSTPPAPSGSAPE